MGIRNIGSLNGLKVYKDLIVKGSTNVTVYDHNKYAEEKTLYDICAICTVSKYDGFACMVFRWDDEDYQENIKRLYVDLTDGRFPNNESFKKSLQYKNWKRLGQDQAKELWFKLVDIGWYSTSES